MAISLLTSVFSYMLKTVVLSQTTSVWWPALSDNPWFIGEFQLTGSQRWPFVDPIVSFYCLSFFADSSRRERKLLTSREVSRAKDDFFQMQLSVWGCVVLKAVPTVMISYLVWFWMT